LIPLRHTARIAIVALAAACSHSDAAALSRQATTRQTDSAEVRAVRQLWDAYVRAKNGRFAGNARTPSTLWSAAEQRRWPLYDLVASYVADDAAAQVMDVRSAGPNTHEYEIVTEFRENRGGDKAAVSDVTTTVYATREDGRWVLANALPRRTVWWRRKTVAPIHYVIEPGLAFDSAKAIRAAAFVDSLADALAVPRLDSLDFYVASSVDAALNALGVQNPVRYGSNGGFAKPVNRQVFSGNPTLGENYRHELAHVVVLPLIEHSPTTILASEGLATWLGGTEGADFRGSVRSLGRYLEAHPSVTLDSVIDSPSIPQAVRYTAGAVLCDMLTKAEGVAAMKEFLQTSLPDVRTMLVRLLGRPWAEIGGEWRGTIDRIASGSGALPI